MEEFREWVKGSRLARLAAVPMRTKAAGRVEAAKLRAAALWLLRSRETQNFTYDLQPRNLEHLAWFVGSLSDATVTDCRNWIDEVLGDDHLRAHIRQNTEASDLRGLADPNARYGRRAGWYALVRALRPELIVETGTDKGLGSCVLASALVRNGLGSLITIDVDPRAGYLIRGAYAEVTERVVADSVSYLSSLNRPVDMFLHDSCHDPAYELAEFEAVTPFLAPGALVLSDNSHASMSLPQWAERRGWKFSFFQEIPADHWYPGGGIGAAVQIARRLSKPSNPATLAR